LESLELLEALEADLGRRKDASTIEKALEMR
jgi:hypothetical protein